MVTSGGEPASGARINYTPRFFVGPKTNFLVGFSFAQENETEKPTCFFSVSLVSPHQQKNVRDRSKFSVIKRKTDRDIFIFGLFSFHNKPRSPHDTDKMHTQSFQNIEISAGFIEKPTEKPTDKCSVTVPLFFR